MIKKKLLKRHENGGRPVIMLENLKYKQGNEILLRHQFDDIPLDYEYAKQTLQMLWKITKKPVNIKTIDVSVTEVTTYAHSNNTPFSRTNGWTFRQKNRQEIEKNPVIYKYDGVRHTRVKDERTAREYKEQGYDI